jgi:hypothetical protein
VGSRVSQDSGEKISAPCWESNSTSLNV